MASAEELRAQAIAAENYAQATAEKPDAMDATLSEFSDTEKVSGHCSINRE